MTDWLTQWVARQAESQTKYSLPERFTSPAGNSPSSAVDERLYEAVKQAYDEAGELFQSTGGSTRHYVLECFCPALERRGVSVSDPVELVRVMREADREAAASGAIDEVYIRSHLFPVMAGRVVLHLEEKT